jgi:hypothetical protein
MTQNQKSLGLAAGIIVVLLLTIGLLLPRAEPTASEPTASEPEASKLSTPELHRVPSHREGTLATTPTRAQIQATAESATARPPVEDDRTMFAAEMGRRFAFRGQGAQVSVSGEDHRVLQFYWPPKSFDRSHLESLKTANPFYNGLRERGFKRLEMKVGSRLVWSKDL